VGKVIRDSKEKLDSRVTKEIKAYEGFRVIKDSRVIKVGRGMLDYKVTRV
jgi:hypothetical protein